TQGGEAVETETLHHVVVRFDHGNVALGELSNQSLQILFMIRHNNIHPKTRLQDSKKAAEPKGGGGFCRKQSWAAARLHGPTVRAGTTAARRFAVEQTLAEAPDQ